MRMENAVPHKGAFSSFASNQSQLITHKQLGQVSTAEGELDESCSHFARSIELARATGNQNEEERCAVMLGVAQGLRGIDQHRMNLVQKAVQQQNMSSELDRRRVKPIADRRHGDRP